MSIKAVGIAVKLTLEGVNQVWYPETWFFLMVAAICVVTQMIYLNKVKNGTCYLLLYDCIMFVLRTFA